MPTQRDGYRTADGKKCPSVTTLIGRFKYSEPLIAWANRMGREGKSHDEVRQTAADAGTMAHELIDADIKNRQPVLPTAEELKTDPFTYQEMLERAQRSYSGFRRWRVTVNFEVLETETSMVSEVYRYGGTPDGFALVNGLLYVLDWKTSRKVYSDYIIQVAAYRELWHENRKTPVSGGIILRADKETGGWEHLDMTDSELNVGWELFKTYRLAYEQCKAVDKVFRKISKEKKAA